MRTMLIASAAALLFFGAAPGAPDAPATSTSSAPAAPPALSPTAPPVLKQVAPDIFEYHGVRLDPKTHTISFPGKVNQRDGLIEYVLVNDKGKTHESLLSTALPPRDIHLAMLLVGLDPAALQQGKDAVPPDHIDLNYLQAAPKLKGAPVRISLKWTANGKTEHAPIEDWVYDLQTSLPMTEGAWTYNGSMIDHGVFLADEDLSIVAVITDPTALANNPRPGYDNDQIWQVRGDKMPPLDTPVEVSITLVATPDASSP